jgi:transcription elongation GreA/GreB family factor
MAGEGLDQRRQGVATQLPLGEDEADPSRGTVSYVSPLARAVLTHRPGETVEIAGRDAVVLDVR